MKTQKLYRARNGILLGVCLGFARRCGLPVALVRLAYLIFVFMTGLLPGLALYLLAAAIMQPEPKDYDSWREREEDFYNRLQRTE